MPASTDERSQRARMNGAKSTGPKTAHGQYRCETASYKHGLYAVRGCMLPGESNEEFAELQSQLHAFFQPIGYFDQELVEKLVAVTWEARRLEASKNDHVHDAVANVAKANPRLIDQAKKNLLAEADVSIPGGKMVMLNARLAQLARERARLTREIWNAKKQGSANSGGSQMSLIINRRQHPDLPETADAKPVDGHQSEGAYTVEATSDPLPPPFTAPPSTSVDDGAPTGSDAPDLPAAAPNISAWAAETFGFNPDEVQRRILEETNTHILVLAPRQTGKSTAAAVRVLYTAVYNQCATILLASASGRQSGQILEKARQLARQMGLDLAGPPPKCEGFTLPNGSIVVALPDSEETIRGFSAPCLIVVDEAAFASDTLFTALEPMLTVSNGTLMLLSTPNGQVGYFYEQWHLQDNHWTNIFGTLEDCPRVNTKAIEGMRKSMAKADFEQEFECKFVASSGQFISVETFRKCLRDDIPPFCPGWDETGF